jgi:hypothetical protein
MASKSWVDRELSAAICTWRFPVPEIAISGGAQHETIKRFQGQRMAEGRQRRILLWRAFLIENKIYTTVSLRLHDGNTILASSPVSSLGKGHWARSSLDRYAITAQGCLSSFYGVPLKIFWYSQISTDGKKICHPKQIS